jgi:hypothetical protein
VANGFETLTRFLAMARATNRLTAGALGGSNAVVRGRVFAGVLARFGLEAASAAGVDTEVTLTVARFGFSEEIGRVVGGAVALILGGSLVAVFLIVRRVAALASGIVGETTAGTLVMTGGVAAGIGTSGRFGWRLGITGGFDSTSEDARGALA